MAGGGEEAFGVVLERYRHPETPQEETRYLMALGGFEHPALAERAFDLAVTEVRTQNGPFLVDRLLANRASGAATWERIERNWESLVTRFPVHILPRMVSSARLLCRDGTLAAHIGGYLAEHPLPVGRRTVEQTVERQGVNVAFRAARRVRRRRPDRRRRPAVLTSGGAGAGASSAARTDDLLTLARGAKGFMPDDEGLALYEAAAPRRARRARRRRDRGDRRLVRQVDRVPRRRRRSDPRRVFSLDHHHGSEENQAGWAHHDLDVLDPATGRIDTLPFWRRTVDSAGLGPVVVGMVGDSPAVAARWRTPVDLCFIDGGHGPSRRGPTTADGRRTWPREDGSPSTTCSPIPPTAVGRRTRSTAPRWSRASS